jgi:rhodanese-related sulfurtransferase
MENLSVDEWKASFEKNNDSTIIDVRTPMEWDSGIINEALTIDFNKQLDFINFIKTLDSSKSYYVYCKSGVRSWHACQMMEHMGLSTFNLKNGINQWDGPLTRLSF